VDSKIYTNEDLHKEEIEKIWNKIWLIACHESEVANAYDYRTFKHPSGRSLIIIRDEAMKVRAFYNTCSHRGNSIVQDPSGTPSDSRARFHHGLTTRRASA
jgi:methanesulfonate monooxygenase large subunit